MREWYILSVLHYMQMRELYISDTVYTNEGKSISGIQHTQMREVIIMGVSMWQWDKDNCTMSQLGLGRPSRHWMLYRLYIQMELNSCKHSKRRIVSDRWLHLWLLSVHCWTKRRHLQFACGVYLYRQWVEFTAVTRECGRAVNLNKNL